jgi:hypothetical protein
VCLFRGCKGVRNAVQIQAALSERLAMVRDVEKRRLEAVGVTA